MPECQGGGWFSPHEDMFVICADCGGRTCPTCDTEMHAGLSCAQAATNRARAAANAAQAQAHAQAAESQAVEEKRRQDEATANYIQQQTKHCPQCGIATEKVSGCDHMTCTPLYQQVILLS